MKRAIITPTFKPHFKYIKKYLESAKLYISDPENVTFFLTVSESDIAELSLLVTPYKDILNIEILSFDSMLAKYNVPYSDKRLLSKYGKFSYQTLKKFYTMLHINYDQMLVLDSESMFIRETNIKDLFNNFFNEPFITVCNLDQMQKVGTFKSKVMENISLILEERKDNREFKIDYSSYNQDRSDMKSIWFLENFVWFYDKKILNDMFDTLGSPFSIIDYLYHNSKESNREQGCFEICLYQGYLYKNNSSYNYNILHVENLLSNIFKSNTKLCQKYEADYYALWGGEFGLLEMAMALLTEENYELFANEFKDNKFNIIRCDFTNLKNYIYQDKFLDILEPNILAASQNHIYGINNTKKDRLWSLLIFNNSFARYIYSDIKGILRPIKPLLVWLKYFYYITKHSLLWIKGVLSNLNIFKK